VTGACLQDTGVKAAARAQQEKDKQLAKLLSHVRVYLPNRERPGPFQNSDQYVLTKLAVVFQVTTVNRHVPSVACRPVKLWHT